MSHEISFAIPRPRSPPSLPPSLPRPKTATAVVEGGVNAPDCGGDQELHGGREIGTPHQSVVRYQKVAAPGSEGRRGGSATKQKDTSVAFVRLNLPGLFFPFSLLILWSAIYAPAASLLRSTSLWSALLSTKAQRTHKT